MGNLETEKGAIHMKITTLIENSKHPSIPELEAEHGLSFYLEIEHHRFLFDLGSSDNFIKNAKILGTDLSIVEAAVISHHHYDHGGGIKAFLDHIPNANIYLKYSDTKEYAFNLFGIKKAQIGLDPSIYSSERQRIQFIREFSTLFENVHIITNIQKAHSIPKGNKFLYKKVDGQLRHDDFSHELMMVMKEKDGLVVLTGCAHNGILNMIETTKSHFPNDPIKMVIGGFHLMGIPKLNVGGESKEELIALANKLLSYEIPLIYTGHCTGNKAYKILKAVMKEKLESLHVGKIIHT